MSYEERARHNRLMHNWNTVIAQATEADADLHALTERLRIVEAERDEARSGVKKSAEAYGALMEHAEKLRAELERKDAALKTCEQALFDHVAIEGDQASTALKAARAALQPKEPPCQTA